MTTGMVSSFIMYYGFITAQLFKIGKFEIKTLIHSSKFRMHFFTLSSILLAFSDKFLLWVPGASSRSDSMLSVRVACSCRSPDGDMVLIFQKSMSDNGNYLDCFLPSLYFD